MKNRLLAAGAYLGVSFLMILFSGILVLKVFYPYPFVEILNGKKLYLLLVAINIILGPLLTFLIFDTTKKRHVLGRDMVVIGTIQLIAFVYGLWVIYIARPVYLVYEIDRFKLITAIDVDNFDLSEAPAEFQKLPFSGVKVIGLRAANNSVEKLYSLELELAGKDLSLQTDWWQSLSDENRASMRKHGVSVTALKNIDINNNSQIKKILDAAQLRDEEVIVLPLLVRSVSWSVLLDKKKLNIIGYLPIDIFDIKKIN